MRSNPLFSSIEDKSLLQQALLQLRGMHQIDQSTTRNQETPTRKTRNEHRWKTIQGASSFCSFPSLLASQSVPEWSTNLSNTSIVLSGSSVESRGGRTVTLHGMSSSHPQPTWQQRARTALMPVCRTLQQQPDATCHWLRHRSRSRRNNTPQTKNNVHVRTCRALPRSLLLSLPRRLLVLVFPGPVLLQWCVPMFRCRSLFSRCFFSA